MRVASLYIESKYIKSMSSFRERRRSVGPLVHFPGSIYHIGSFANSVQSRAFPTPLCLVDTPLVALAVLFPIKIQA